MSGSRSGPVPGDPDQLRAHARRLRDVADELGRSAQALRSLETGQVWWGTAQRTAEDDRVRTARDLGHAAVRYGRSSDAVHRFAAELEQAQTVGLAGERGAERAHADLAAADVGIAAMRRHHQHAAAEAAAWNAANPTLPARSPAPWWGPDWYAARRNAEAARLAAARTIERALDLRDGAVRRLVARLDAATSDGLTDRPWLLDPAGSFASLFGLGGARGDVAFVRTDRGLVANTAEAWRDEAYLRAGIDPDRWVPARGLARTDAEARAAWELYADVYASDPDAFLWAGMAKLAGGTFYAGFQDVHTARRAVEGGGRSLADVEEVLRRLFPALPQAAVAAMASAGADQVAEDLRWVEQQFLGMQKDIFDDLAWQHVAYQEGGLEAMEALAEDGQIEPWRIRAWRDIASGDPARVVEGNRALLHHEQWTVIGPAYDQMREHSIVTRGLTLGMSMIAESPVPGGRPFREVVPFVVGFSVDTPDRVPLVPDRFVPDRIPGTGVRIPGGDGLYVDTPDRIGARLDLPLHDVSIADNRWRWIETDMLPAYDRLRAGGGADPLIATPIEDLAATRRTLPDRLFPYDLPEDG